MTGTQLLSYVRTYRYGMLGRKRGSKYCYMVCYPLQSLLSLEGVETELIEGEVCYYRYWIGHFWLRMTDGKIIDPTAEQFATETRKMPRVYIGPKPRWYRAKS